jgi:hypothetical protein
MPDDMITSDPLKTSEGFAFGRVLNFKFPKIFSSASELRVLALRGPKTPAKVESTQSNRVSNNSEVSLPITTFQRLVSSYAAGEREPVIYINSAKNDIRRSYTVFTKTMNAVATRGQ